MSEGRQRRGGLRGLWSRLYRGEHHPTDILASLLFAGLWLTATTLLIKPNDVTRRPAAGRARTAAPDRTDVTARR